MTRAAEQQLLALPYEQIPALNWSTLKHLAVSPQRLKWRENVPEPDTAAYQLGRALHCAIFEPERFLRSYTAEPECPPMMTKSGQPAKNPAATAEGKAWLKAWHEEHADFETLSAADLELVDRMSTNVRAHRVASRFLDGEPEKPIVWTDPETGIQCKARIDNLHPLPTVVDLKSTIKETCPDFVRYAGQRLYHGQLAWYFDGAVAGGYLPPTADRPIIIAAHKSDDCDVSVYQLTETSLDAGRAVYRGLLRMYAQCSEAKWWPGICTDLLPFDLPRWAPGMTDDEDDEGDEW